MKNLFRKAKLLSMVILVLTFLGCEEDDEGSKLPAVTAGFTFDLIPNTGSVSFINISENANTFEWDFGNGTTSTEINPTVTFVSGTYTVSLTASNVAGASDAFEDTVTITIPEPPGPVALPIDFDGANVDYDAIVGDNIGFSVVTNPETANGNTTNVGQMVAGGGQFQNVQFPLGTAVDFSGDDKAIELELFSSTEIAVLVKFEDGVNGARDVEVGVTHTGSGWETLSFNFATNAVASFIEGDAQNGQALVPDGQYGKMILFIGFNTNPGVEGTFLVDNISQTTGDGGGNMGGGSLEDCGGDLVNDFETADDSIFNNFGGGVGTIIDNPDTSVNMSAKVGQYVKNAGEVFGGITIEVDPDIDFNAGVFSIDVYSVAVRQLLFKLEGLNIEAIVPTSGTGWETITYDFSAVGGNMGMATAITLIMDNGTAGDGSADWTIQFDNIRLCSNESTGGGNSLEDCGGDLVNDFETADDSIFNNFGGGVGTIIDNPDTSVNMSAKVGQYVKNAGEVFGGITIEVDPDIDFNAGVFSIDVYSVAVRQLLFKLEGLNIEAIVPTSGTGWETITYDFSAVGGNVGAVTAITLIMDNGTAGDGSADWTIQFDNIRLCSNGSSGGGGCSGGPTMDVAAFPVDFENCEGFNVSFGSLQTREIVDNPVSGGINTSDKVYQFVKPSGADGFGGFQNIFDMGTFTNNSTITFKIYSTQPNQEVRLEIIAIPNDGGAIGNPAPYNQTLTTANEWVEMSFDLSANAFPNSSDETVYTMLVVKPGNIDGGNTPSDVTFYVDDFAITAN